MAQPITLRRAGPGDIEALSAIYAACARERGPEAYTEPQVRAWASFAADRAAFEAYVLGAETWVAVEGAAGRVLGFSGCDEQGEVRSLYVAVGAQRSGLGARLLGHVIERARSRGLRVLAAWVTPFSRALFLRQGFRWVETVRSPFAGELFERYRVLWRASDDAL
jgi:L-amino acid N-acyltransferase YncA